MSKIRTNAQGFTAVETVAVVIVIAIIALVGWHLHAADTKTSQSANSTSKASQLSKKLTDGGSAAASPQQNNDFTISEWGVEAPEAPNLPPLEYVIDPTNPNVANFTSAELKSSDSSSGCGNGDSYTSGNITYHYDGGGLIVRLLPTAAIPNYFSQSKETVQGYFANGGSAPHAQVGAYYYLYVPFSGCSKNPAATTIESQTNNAVQLLTTGLKAITN